MGKKQKASKSTAAKKDDVQNVSPPSDITVGCFAALRLAKYYDEIPQIGRVVALDTMNVTVEWWLGAYTDNWREWKVRGKVVTETFPRNAVLCADITFTKSFRLPSSFVSKLKSLYSCKELI